MPKLQKNQIQKNYSKVLWGFIITSVIVVTLILYFSFSKTTITIIPQPEVIATDFQFDVQAAHDDGTVPNPRILYGNLIETTVSGEKTVSDITETEQMLDKATGTATLINNYSAAQPLVATTRLLSDDGVLYRTTETVTVPARGSKVVGIIADQAGSFEIGPSHFTIVALWTGLQDKIYAESSVPTTRTGEKIQIATSEDIRNAQDALLAELQLEATENLKREARIQYPHLDFLENASQNIVQEETADIEPGAQVNSFTVYTTLRSIVFLGSIDQLKEAALQSLQAALPENKKLLALPDPSFEYHLESADMDALTAKLVGHIEDQMILTLSHPILNRKEFLGKDAQEIRTYFTNFSEIADVDVSFSPFWVRNTPTLEDHIDIIIANP